MARFSREELQKWRKSLGVSAQAVADAAKCDVSTYYKYERGTVKHLTPDVMFMICEFLGDWNVWCDWMRTEFATSYGVVHPESESLELPGAFMQMMAETHDVVDIERTAMRDVADGQFDDPAVRAAIEKEVSESIAASQRFLNRLRSTGGGTPH